MQDASPHAASDDTVSIGELARQAGVATSALRFWEAEGLLEPTMRTASGYRRYDGEAVARVGFIGRAQALGLSLTEVAELLDAADGDGGASVKERLRHLVAHKLDETRRRVAELEGFAGQLERIWGRLQDEGGCGCHHLGECACLPPTLDTGGRRRLRTEVRLISSCTCGCDASMTPISSRAAT